MPIPGLKLEEIRNAFLSAFNKASLKQMVRFRLNRDLDDIVADAALKDMVFNLLLLAEEEGWEFDLVKEAQRFVPGNAALGAVYEKIGLAPSIKLVDQGQVQSGENTQLSGGLERVVRRGNPSVDMAVWRSRISEVEVRLCRVDVNQSAAGTGFLVGPGAILTNYHVVRDILQGKKPLTSLSALFDYKILANGTKTSGLRVAVKEIVSYSLPTEGELVGTPEATLPKPTEMDYALLRLETAMGEAPAAPDAPESPQRGWETLPAGPLSFNVGQGLIIAQHPAGEPMKLSVDTAGVLSVNALENRLRYTNNTEGGSSGSPVYDFAWNLVALHHMGDPARGQDPTYNQGIIPLANIRKRIGDQGFASLLG